MADRNDDNPTQNPLPQVPKPEEGPHHDLTGPNSCPICGGRSRRTNFRTGSVQHPGSDMYVCSRCGTRH